MPPSPGAPPPPAPPQLLFAYSQGVSKLRAKFISTLPRGGTSHTVLVTDIPGIDKGTMSNLVHKVGAV